MRHTLIYAALGAMLAVAVPTSLAAQTKPSVEVVIEPFDAVIENPCNGESVQFTGYMRTTTRQSTDANGFTHYSYTIVPHVTGEGPSGAYKLVGTTFLVDRSIDFQANPAHFNTNDHFHIVSQGKALNFMAMLTSHLSTDAEGVARRAFTRENLRCTGG